jgi:CRISPR-associated endonuclease Cas1
MTTRRKIVLQQTAPATAPTARGHGTRKEAFRMHHDGSAPRDGILVASGYGLKIYVERGHLLVHDGVGRDHRTRRMSRATSGLQRLVVIGHTGFVTLEALRWIRDVGASFVQIGSDGHLIAVSSAERFHKTKLRRAQALAAQSELGITAMQELVAAKLEQQAARAESLAPLWPPKPNGGKGQVEIGAVIRRQLSALRSAGTLQQLRASEAVAGRWYWQTLASVPVLFDSSWQNGVPSHWQTAGARTSPPSGFKSSRKASTPFHALINYGYAILETEATIALQAHGFDPGMGILHTDKRYRGSLAHDLMEPIRPVVDGMVLELLAERALERGEVYETREGVCRLRPSMARSLAAWAPSLRPAVANCARELEASLLGTRATHPARRRNATTAGKGGKRRVALHV